MSGLPGGGVVIEAARLAHHPACVPSVADTRYPLSLRRAEVVAEPDDPIWDQMSYGAPRPWYRIPIAADGDIGSYSVTVWIGEDSSEADRRLVDRVLATFTPPRPLSCLYGDPVESPP